LRIVELTACHVRIPLRRPVRHVSLARTAADDPTVSAELVTVMGVWLCYASVHSK
jgi:hypothetical protein